MSTHLPHPDALCECEHVDHFEVTTHDHHLDGTTVMVQNPTKHRYARVRATVAIPTPHGTFDVCDDCAATCLHAFITETSNA